MMTRWFAGIFACMFAGFVIAQSAPSAAQLELLRSLPADEQRRLASQYGIELPSAAGNSDRPQEQRNQADVFPSRGQNRLDASRQTPFGARFDDLKPFGYDLFASSPSTFAPVGSIPAPETYVVGPGDRFRVLFFGKESADFFATVDRNGTLAVQDIGRLNVQGLPFDAVRQLISTRVRERKIGVDVSVTLDELRSVQIFVLGDVEQPGSFTVSSLSTVTNSLFVAGGITQQGTLRDVQLKRNGQTIARLDLYDLLLKGDVSGDLRIQQGDVIFVPSVGTQVAVSGEVNRAAIFEVAPDETLDDVLDFASGFSGFAYTADVRLARTIDGVRRVSRSLSESELSTLNPISGDVIDVMSIVERPEAAVELVGLVARPGFLEWTPGMRLTDVFTDPSDLMAEPDSVLVIIEPAKLTETSRIRVLRASSIFSTNTPKIEIGARDRIAVIPVKQTQNERVTYYVSKQQRKQQAQLSNLPIEAIEERERINAESSVRRLLSQEERAQTELGSDSDPFITLLAKKAGLSDLHQNRGDTGSEMQERDRPSQMRLDLLERGLLDPIDTDQPFVDRRLFFDELVSRVEATAQLGAPPSLVTVRGEVGEPGIYPLPQSGAISDAVLLAGGINSGADLSGIELIQPSADGFQVQRLENPNLEIGQRLKPGTEIIIRRDQNQVKLPAVTVAGFVRFPGTYRMPKSSTLRDLIERAGGVTEQGDLKAAIFSRKTLREQERTQLTRLRRETESQLAQQAIQGSALGAGADAGAVGATLELSRLLREVESTTAVGRLVIDLPKVLAGQLEQDVILEEGDALVVPGIRQSVTVIGEVLYPTSHIFELGVTADDYMSRSGGLSRRADASRAYIIRANGAVQPLVTGNFITRKIQDGPVIEPGDTIVVTRDVDDVPALQLWTAVTQIVYQSAIAISAIGGIDF